MRLEMFSFLWACGMHDTFLLGVAGFFFQAIEGVSIFSSRARVHEFDLEQIYVQVI